MNDSRDLSAQIELLEEQLNITQESHFAVEYWSQFKEANSHDLAKIAQTLTYFLSESFSLTDFYLAALHTKSASMPYCFDCIRAMKQEYDQKELYQKPYLLWGLLEECAAYCKADGTYTLTEPLEMSDRTFRYEYREIIISGSLAMIGKCASALIRLAHYTPETLSFIKKHVPCITESAISGMAVELTPATFLMASDVYNASITWCASCIYHEAIHSALYQKFKVEHPGKAVPYIAYAGKENERYCNKEQLVILEAIHAPESEISHLRAQDGSHASNYIS